MLRPTRRGRNQKNDVSATTPLQPDSQSSDNELREVDRLLRLIYHRNKNQHRTQKWWKWVGMLRRSIRKLLVFQGKGWKRREEERKREYLEGRVRDVLLPKAWLAFTTLVADNQFSTLGIVLIAVLARVGRIVGLPEVKPRLSVDNVDVERLLTSSVRETGQESGSIVLREYVEDMGKIIERRSDEVDRRSTSSLKEMGPSKDAETWNPSQQLESLKLEKPEQDGSAMDERLAQLDVERINPPRRPKKGRRKDNNVIDDLFRDLA